MQCKASLHTNTYLLNTYWTVTHESYFLKKNLFKSSLNIIKVNREYKLIGLGKSNRIQILEKYTASWLILQGIFNYSNIAHENWETDMDKHTHTRTQNPSWGKKVILPANWHRSLSRLWVWLELFWSWMLSNWNA